MGKKRPMGGKIDNATRAVAAVAVERSCAILVVEGDPDQQWRLARALTVLGHRVVGTSSADGALALVREWPVDLVLVSDTVVGSNELDLANLVNDARPGVPVVLVARAESPLTRAEALFAGFFECVVKPFRPEMLSDLLGRLPASPAAA